MRSILLATALSLITFSFGSVLPNSRRDSGLLRLSVAAANLRTPNGPQILKRRTALNITNFQTGTLYLVDLSIGTPPQKVTLAIDTASSDTWVNPTCTTAAQGDQSFCEKQPVYNLDASSTESPTGYSANLPFGTQGLAMIDYYTDDFVIGGASLTNQIFGVASSTTNLRTGVMGIGPGHELTNYNTILDQLALQGITNSRAFSLDLRDSTSPNGAIIFGGIDTKKFTGSLEKLSIIPPTQSPDGSNRYWIYLASVGITKPGEAPRTFTLPPNDNSAHAAYFGSGNTLTYVPQSIYDSIIAEFPTGHVDGATGLYFVPCDVATQLGSVDFTFGATIINVKYRDLVWSGVGPNTCALGILPSASGFILGDSFLRAAFVVFDLDNKNVHLANAVDCGTNLVSIGSGPGAVPSVVGDCTKA